MPKDSHKDVAEEPPKQWARIVTPDGYSYIVERRVACSSPHFADALSDDSGFTESRTNTCPLDERAAVAERVVEFLAHKAQWSGKKGAVIPSFKPRVPPELALEILHAADYLQA